MKKYILLLLLLAGTYCSKDSEFTENLAPTSDYVFYWENATLPALYMGINVLTHTKPSFMFMEREGTFDMTKLPANVTVVKGGRPTVDAYMIAKIAELNTANPNATFTFYVNENRFSRVFNYFYRQGISKDRVKVVQISDGSYTYTLWNLIGLKLPTAFDGWRDSETAFLKEFNKKNSVEPLDVEYFADEGAHYVPAILSPSYQFWMQWPELLVTDSEDLENYLNEKSEKFSKIDPLKYYQALSTGNQQRFLTLVGLDKKWTDGEGGGTLKDQTIGEALDISPKPNIIITGSYPYSASDRDTDKYIAQVKSYYGAGYDYFFKGHPGEQTHPSDKSIVVLPFKLPMEAIIWAFGDNIAVLGGYESSLYMNAPQEMDKFFFNENENGSTLVAPLNQMFKLGLLGNIRFFN